MPTPTFTLVNLTVQKLENQYYDVPSVTAGSFSGPPPTEGQLWPRGNWRKND